MSEPRSWLFVPADSEKKILHALETDADAVIFDLEDSVAPARKAAAREGFTGKLAIHPAQVAVINAAFTPTADDVAHARDIVAAFEAQPDAGVLSVGGKMVDRPHLVQAKRVLERASL